MIDYKALVSAGLSLLVFVFQHFIYNTKNQHNICSFKIDQICVAIHLKTINNATLLTVMVKNCGLLLFLITNKKFVVKIECRYSWYNMM